MISKWFWRTPKPLLNEACKIWKKGTWNIFSTLSRNSFLALSKAEAGFHQSSSNLQPLCCSSRLYFHARSSSERHSVAHQWLTNGYKHFHSASSLTPSRTASGLHFHPSALCHFTRSTHCLITNRPLHKNSASFHWARNSFFPSRNALHTDLHWGVETEESAVRLSKEEHKILSFICCVFFGV